jgi:hypothetical protein
LRRSKTSRPTPRKLADMKFAFALTGLVWVSACSNVRQSTMLAYSGQDPRFSIPSVEAEIAKKGYKPVCKQRAFCKFQPNEQVWVHIKASSREVVLLVDVIDGKDKPPADVEALRAEGEKVGREVWKNSIPGALRSEERAEVAARDEQEREDREARESAAREPDPTALQEMMNRTAGGARTSGSSAERGSTESTNSSGLSCCINGSFYSCGDTAAVQKCSGETTACLMRCMNSSSANCGDKCLQDHPPDPSACSREASRDSQCKR